MERKKVCSFCGSPTHNAFNCHHKHRSHIRPHSSRPKPIKRVSSKANQREAIAKRTWFINNPPDHMNGYTCYLQISRQCPKWLHSDEMVQEHIYPKSKYPELRYIVINRKAACTFCNEIKGSNLLESLAYIYPQIYSIITTAEWLAWEEEIAKYMKPELHKRDRGIIMP